MNIYSRKQQWKWLLLIAAFLIVAASLWLSSRLVQKISVSEKRNVELWAEAVKRKALMMGATIQLYDKISAEEKKKVELWAEASRLLSQVEDDNIAFPFVLAVIVGNETVPVIVTDENGKILLKRNLDSAKEKDPVYLQKELEEMRKQHDSIPIDLSIGSGPNAKLQMQYLYYKDSEVFEEIRKSYEDNERSFIKEVASNPASAPAIYTDSSSNIITYGNLDTIRIKKEAGYLRDRFEDLKLNGDTIQVSLGYGKKNIIYYMESPQLQALRYFPVIMFVIVGMFIVVAYLLFSTSRRSEQNLVWVGMAKETAHQLGTPLSSLIAWLEYLKLKGVNDEMTQEIGQDVKRLEMITERFSKIGSQPKLNAENINDALLQSVEYISKRSPKSVEFIFNPKGSILVPLNIPLFAWVIENLCRNAVDAMDGSGRILIEVSDLQQYVYIDISDTGKGIPRSSQKTIFEPGFTTKKRGWGLGLSLVKRIIEQYHGGKIFVKRSETGKGTTFRIVLNK
ncbi:MAG: HAMP domain-containing histidine kinase [Bacteroidota bacterium]|nr:HAMP domain-containing histidine kinase [Bacteroidota bacterium]